MASDSNSSIKTTIYVNAPFSRKTANKVRALAKRNNRSAGKQVAWMVERFMEER